MNKMVMIDIASNDTVPRPIIKPKWPCGGDCDGGGDSDGLIFSVGDNTIIKTPVCSDADGT